MPLGTNTLERASLEADGAGRALVAARRGRDLGGRAAAFDAGCEDGRGVAARVVVALAAPPRRAGARAVVAAGALPELRGGEVDVGASVGASLPGRLESTSKAPIPSRQATRADDKGRAQRDGHGSRSERSERRAALAATVTQPPDLGVGQCTNSSQGRSGSAARARSASAGQTRTSSGDSCSA